MLTENLTSKRLHLLNNAREDTYGKTAAWSQDGEIFAIGNDIKHNNNNIRNVGYGSYFTGCILVYLFSNFVTVKIQINITCEKYIKI